MPFFGATVPRFVAFLQTGREVLQEASCLQRRNADDSRAASLAIWFCTPRGADV
ncbi:Unknown protein sequence [Pseudomonas coronafaciens pv. oryzae]|nr:Unknown protein sequence [Pseudomonas coronafaciens pv. oryzae]